MSGVGRVAFSRRFAYAIDASYPGVPEARVPPFWLAIVCSVLAPFAWVMGNRAVAEIDANPGVYDGRGEAQAGRILGIIGTVLLILGIVAFAFFIVLIIAGVASSDTSSDYSELSLISLFA